MFKLSTLAAVVVGLTLTSPAMATTTEPSVSIIESFETIFGINKGKRRNHANGFCFAATFTPTQSLAQKLSTSELFSHPSSVIGRFSHKGGNPHAPDDKPDDLGMGLAFMTESGEQHFMAMNSLPFFPVATPEAFAQLMHAKTQGKEAVAAFKASNKAFQRFVSQKPKEPVRPFEAVTYNSINSFYLVNAKNKKTAVRWSFKPVNALPINQTFSKNMLFDNIQENLKNHVVAWDMVITLANPDDRINDASIPWTGKHQQFIAGRLQINDVMRQAQGQCGDINYDPMTVSTGFQPSADPLLLARRKAYAISFGKRMAERH